MDICICLDLDKMICDTFQKQLDTFHSVDYNKTIEQPLQNTKGTRIQ